jgi:signal transduction histidine kinase
VDAIGLMSEASAERRVRATAVAAIVVVAGIGFGALGELSQARYSDRPQLWILADFLGGSTFLVTGAIAWVRRPGSRIGPVLLGIGLSWFVGTHTRDQLDWAAHLARGFQGWYEPLIGLVILSYPTGRLVGRVERAVMAVWLVDQAVWCLAQLVLLRPLSWYACATCPATVDAFVADRLLIEAVAPVTLAISIGAGLLVVLLAARRVLEAGPAGRRRLLPVVIGGLALTVGITVPNGLRLTLDPAFYVDPRVAALSYAIDMLAAVAVLAGLLQDRLARTAIADLVIDLQRHASTVAADPIRFRTALARALGDASLELLPYDRTAGTYRDAGGASVALPRPGPKRAVTLVGEGGDAVAAIIHDPALLDDPGLISAVTAAIRLESDNRELAAQVDRQLAELRASRARIVTASDAERRRVERDLHDGAQQRLVALSMELGRLRTAAGASTDPAMADALAGLSRELEQAIEELRELARGILPPILTDAGLAAALESIAMRAPLPVTTEVTLSGRLPAAIESTLYFVISEGLANVARHAHASRARVRVGLAGDLAWVEVQDDGVGTGAPREGTGLQGLRDRVGALGGRLQVLSEAGQGTTLRAELPVPA